MNQLRNFRNLKKKRKKKTMAGERTYGLEWRTLTQDYYHVYNKYTVHNLLSKKNQLQCLWSICFDSGHFHVMWPTVQSYLYHMTRSLAIIGWANVNKLTALRWNREDGRPSTVRSGPWLLTSRISASHPYYTRFIVILACNLSKVCIASTHGSIFSVGKLWCGSAME